MDGFNAVCWKETPCFGLARQQVAQQTGDQHSWNLHLTRILHEVMSWARIRVSYFD